MKVAPRQIAPGLYSLLLFGASQFAQAQELEPRAYSPNPIGVNFALLGYSHSTGGVLFDPSVPVDNVKAELNSGVAGFGRAFALFGRSTTAILAVPYAVGDVSGDVGEARRSITRSGLADPRLKLSINLLGDEAMKPREFATRKPRTTLGASLTVVPPLGQYDSTKLINLGANRWSFKSEIGVSHPVGQWYLEAQAGVWLFTDNDNFYGGQHREQDPITSLQGHVSYTIRPQFWVAADATYYQGGRTTVNGDRNANLQENTRVGLTVSVPIAKRHSLKLTWSEGASTRIGGDFTNYGVAWQYIWFD